MAKNSWSEFKAELENEIDPDDYGMGYQAALDHVDDWMDTQPKVVHSKWDTVFYERNGTLASYSHLCPECKFFYRDVNFKGHNFCPHCGAKMDGGNNNENHVG